MQEVDADLTALDRGIINAFQGGFPVTERPFEPAAAALRERGIDVTGPELCERVRELDEAGTLSRFGALVNAEEIGGAASLVAMHAPKTGTRRSRRRSTSSPRWRTTTSASIPTSTCGSS